MCLALSEILAKQLRLRGAWLRLPCCNSWKTIPNGKQRMPFRVASTGNICWGWSWLILVLMQARRVNSVNGGSQVGAEHLLLDAVLVLCKERGWLKARERQRTYIGTEHLLLGLVREEEGVASQVLRNLGIEVEQVSQAIEGLIGRGERNVPGEVGLTPRAKKVIEFAVDEARRFMHHFIGTEHMLLGLLREGDGMAAGVLENFDLHLEQVRTETLRVLREQHQGQTETSAIPSVPLEASTLLAEGEPELPCTFCGARCPGYFRYCFSCGQPLIHKEESSQGEEK